VEIQGSKFPVSKPQIKFSAALFVFLGRFSLWVRKRVGLGTYLRLRAFRRITDEIGTAERGYKQKSPRTPRGALLFDFSYC
jgi:hypothetical protein